MVITDATEVPKADENALMAAIALNPISLSVDASGNGTFRREPHLRCAPYTPPKITYPNPNPTPPKP